MASFSKSRVKRTSVLYKSLGVATFAGLTLIGTSANAQDDFPEINVDNMSSSNSIIWNEISKETADNSNNVLSINVFQSGETTTKYYQYSYNNDRAYENIIKDNQDTSNVQLGTQSNHTKYYTPVQQNLLGSTISINKTLFDNNKVNIIAKTGNYYVDIYGSALYNSGIIENLDADFTNNEIYGDIKGGARDETFGGALSNDGQIGVITGDFINNHAISGPNSTNNRANIRGEAHGGALYTSGHIDEVKGNFINNSTEMINPNASLEQGAYGGAVYISTDGSIGLVEGDFVQNKAVGYGAYGGAIYSNGEIGTIRGNFIGNSITNGSVGANWRPSGGAIIIDGGSVGNIEADFYSNNATSSTRETRGGAIALYSSEVGTIHGDFVGNYATSDSRSYAGDGGAIYLTGSTVNEISGVFAYNYTDGNNTNYGYGGAIENAEGSTINAINADFIGNSAYYRGGAVANNGTNSEVNIGSINGNFYDNVSGENGGAIINYSQYSGSANIASIVGKFIDNNARGNGGAIYSEGYSNGSAYIGSIKGEFIRNSASAEGGAVYNKAYNGVTAIMDNIAGTFIENSAGTNGGAIYNRAYGGCEAIIDKVTGYFENNSAGNYGGAIYNLAQHSYSFVNINEINGTFKGNSAVAGGGIYSNGNLGNIQGVFTENYAQNDTLAQGGGIYSSGRIKYIENSEFNANYAQSTAGNAEGGAVYNSGTFVLNADEPRQSIYVYKYILTNSSTGETVTVYQNNIDNIQQIIADGYKLEIIENENPMEVDNTTWSMVEEYIANGQFIEENPLDAAGVTEDNIFVEKIGGIINSSFTNNYAKSIDGTANGGAIYTSKDLQLIAKDGYAFKVSGNYVEDKDGKRSEGIYVASEGIGAQVEMQHIGTVEETDQYIYQEVLVPTETKSTTLTLNATDNAKFVIEDQIVGSKPSTQELTYHKYPIMDRYDSQQGWVIDVYLDENGEVTDNPELITETVSTAKSKLLLKGDSTGEVYLNNDVKNLDIEHNDVTTYVNGMKYLNHAQAEGINSLTMNSGTLNVGSFNLSPLHFDTFGMNGGTINIDKVDVDLANKVMGRITANSYTGTDKGTINVKSMNVLSDGEKDVTPVLFADKSFKNTVKSPVKEAYTKLYRYDVSYDSKGTYGQDGYFVFTRGGNGGNPSDGFNPAVLTSPVVTQSGASAAMNEALYYAFEHGDTFMNFSAMDRFAKINSNTYALAERQGAMSTDFNDNLNIDYVHQNKGVWTKPYSSFDTIHLKNGPKANVISYGTLVGFDSNIHKLKRGWSNVATAYLGYNGSQIDYSHVDASTNGGLFGLTETFYKGNFWTALTATAGASFSEVHTMYGKDEMTTLMAGIGSKTGYNFEFKEGKFIVQPRLFMSYSFINTFDYTNSAGVRIDSDPMHTLQINPSVKFIGNIKGWQPYASVGMVWNLLNETHTEANGVKLPEMHTRPYVEYGLGLQRTWDDKFSAYGQAMVRNGGKNGVSLTLGFRWALGKAKSEKVNKPNTHLKRVQKPSKKQVVKQHSPQLKQVPVQTSQKKVIKQLSITQKQHLEHTTRTSMQAVIN